MIKTEKIYGFLQSTQMEASQLRLLIENWFTLVRLSYQPTEYYYNQQERNPTILMKSVGCCIMPLKKSIQKLL